MGVGALGLIATAPLAWASKISRASQLALSSSSLSCIALGLLACDGKRVRILKVQEHSPNVVQDHSPNLLAITLAHPQPGTFFFDVNFEVKVNEGKTKTLTGKKILKKYGADIACRICVIMNFKKKEYPKIDLDTAIEALEQYSQKRGGKLSYKIFNKNGERVYLNLFNSCELEKFICTLDEKEQEILAKDIQSIVQWDPLSDLSEAGYGFGGQVFQRAFGHIEKITDPEQLRLYRMLEKLKDSYIPKEGETSQKMTADELFKK